jgi:hypothetical protein
MYPSATKRPYRKIRRLWGKFTDTLLFQALSIIALLAAVIIWWTFIVLLVPFRILWNFAGEKKERSIMLAIGSSIILFAHPFYA